MLCGCTAGGKEMAGGAMDGMTDSKIRISDFEFQGFGISSLVRRARRRSRRAAFPGATAGRGAPAESESGFGVGAGAGEAAEAASEPSAASGLGTDPNRVGAAVPSYMEW